METKKKYVSPLQKLIQQGKENDESLRGEKKEEIEITKEKTENVLIIDKKESDIDLKDQQTEKKENQVDDQGQNEVKDEIKKEITEKLEKSKKDNWEVFITFFIKKQKERELMENIRVSTDIRDKLRIYAMAMKSNLTTVVDNILEDWCEKNEDNINKLFKKMKS